MLPLTLDNIKRIANQCVQSANSTIYSYKNLSAFLRELTEIMVGTQTSTDAGLQVINDLINNSTKEQELLNLQIEEIRKEFEVAREALQKAHKEYYEAYHVIPGRRKRFLGGFISTVVSGALSNVLGNVLTNVVGGILNNLGCIFSSCSGEVDNTAFENAKKKAELALQRLKEAQGIYDQWYAKMLEKQNKLTGIIFQLSQLDMNTVDHQTVINILVSATKEVIHIQEQWDKMIRFFAKLSMQAEHTQQTILFEFIAVIQAADLASGMLDDADREFYVMLLLETANEIDRGAHLLYIMSKTYYDVSYQYMMSQIAGISRLILTQTNQERESLMKQIAQDTLSASARVSRMALERRQQYEQRNQERQEVYERFIQQATLEELQSTIGK
ncbi:unnamed protein product [Rotaria sordida]|uniref:Uncharacterized protein n=1 Tax=Rotaria sordida TaxID=392033 RepID=A0A819MBI1_9BILA|nr:unnamed protein product [Rotaria sordida]CAF1478365.1 unnamed protein product [Rotaria sordida]CAF1608013.1 unnamed protein product [Rotaria sordida]CAF3977229.1 unnamed protein product [Rotaria sordida]CAF4095533.1 unnamed protein product [Rotaria sordida]